jgi:hypothetical protein
MKNMINDLEEIAHLYDEFYLIPEASLLQEPVAVSKEKEKTEKKLIYRGKNLKQIAFLFQSNENELSETDMQMLHKLLAALQLNPDDIAWVYLLQNPDVDLSNVLTELNCLKAVLWGSSAQPSHTLQLATDAKVLHAMHVSSYHENIPMKTELWKQLQPLLNG